MEITTAVLSDGDLDERWASIPMWLTLTDSDARLALLPLIIPASRLAGTAIPHDRGTATHKNPVTDTPHAGYLRYCYYRNPACGCAVFPAHQHAGNTASTHYRNIARGNAPDSCRKAQVDRLSR